MKRKKVFRILRDVAYLEHAGGMGREGLVAATMQLAFQSLILSELAWTNTAGTREEG